MPWSDSEMSNWRTTKDSPLSTQRVTTITSLALGAELAEAVASLVKGTPSAVLSTLPSRNSLGE
jgi:hypothetical protein